MNIMINGSVHSLHQWPAFYLYHGELVLVGPPEEHTFEHNVMSVRTGDVVKTTSVLSTKGFIRLHGKLEFAQ